MRRSFRALLLVAVALLAVLVFRPVAVQPSARRPPVGPALDGVLATNEELTTVELLAEGRLPGPEDAELDMHGRLITGLEDGRIVRFVPTDTTPDIEEVVDTGGRPLGLDLGSDGTLWVADTHLGLLAVDEAGRVEVHVTEAEGGALAFADDVDTSTEGRVYFSDASAVFGPERLAWAPFESPPSGRLIEYDPDLRSTRVLLGELHFANGVAVATDGSFVLVAETFAYRVHRYWLTGRRRGESEIFADNLPGFPDGISSDGEGGFWLALFTVRHGALDRFVLPNVWLQRLIVRLPDFLVAGARRYGLVLRLDDRGSIVESLHDPKGNRFANVTSVEQWGRDLYLGSIESHSLGRYRLTGDDR